MAKIRGKDTGPEKIVAGFLDALGLSYESHSKELPGRPDFVLCTHNAVIFVDGDFWHGWRFPLWRHKLSPAWQEKIQKTRERDARNHRKLRRTGWRVLRIWEHQLEQNPNVCRQRIEQFLQDGFGNK